MKTIFSLILLLSFTAPVMAADDVMKDFDKLGNDVLLEKAKALEPNHDVSVVQNRLVDRHMKFEFAPEFGAVLGGDPYVNTRSFGLNFHFHVSPYVSLGVKYASMSNELSSEANSLINGSLPQVGKSIVPDIDYAKDETMGLVNIYPFYGKLKVFNWIAHFDIYGILGYGNINLRSGETKTWTTGAGVGFWITKNFTTRWELRYQNYKAERYDGEADMNLTVSSLQAGLMF